MKNRNGQRLDIWMPQELIELIDAQRGWRTRSEFIRNLIDGTLTKTAKGAPDKQPTCTAPPPTADEFAIVSALIDPDPSYWRAYAKPYGGIDVEFFAHLTTMPIFMDGLAEHRAQKTPH